MYENGCPVGQVRPRPTAAVRVAEGPLGRASARLRASRRRRRRRRRRASDRPAAARANRAEAQSVLGRATRHPGRHRSDPRRSNETLDRTPYLCRVRPVRTTNAVVQVAAALMERPADQHWGYDLSKRAEVRSGVLYPILRRMLEEGWLVDGWEDATEQRAGRPPRRYYEITQRGAEELGALLSLAAADARFTSPALRPGAAW